MVQLLPPGGGMLAGSSSSSGHAVQQRTTTTLHAPAANGRAACLRRAPARRCSCPAVKVEPSSNEGVRLQAPARHGSSWGASSSSSLRAPTDAAAAAPPDSSWSSRLAFERLYHLSSSSSSNSDAAGGLSSAQDLWLRGLFLVSVDDKPRTSLPPPQKGSGGGGDKSPDYYANVGDAIRTLREDIPLLFKQDLNYEIYRDDITFRDPRNSFTGMKNYQLIFWSLRFHGRIFFSSLYVEVRRIWQPSDGVICMRWTVHGVPRVPWEAEGTFDGISKYTLDSEGKIYEHAVDNVMLRDPPVMGVPLLAGLNLVPNAAQQQPCPGAWFRGLEQGAAAAAASAASAASAAATTLDSATMQLQAAEQQLVPATAAAGSSAAQQSRSEHAR